MDTKHWIDMATGARLHVYGDDGATYAFPDGGRTKNLSPRETVVVLGSAGRQWSPACEICGQAADTTHVRLGDSYLEFCDVCMESLEAEHERARQEIKMEG